MKMSALSKYCLMAFLLIGCAQSVHRLSERSSSDSPNTDLFINAPYPAYKSFCEKAGISDPKWPEFMKRPEIEESTQAWLDLIECSPEKRAKGQDVKTQFAEEGRVSRVLGAYAYAYLEVTAERDRQRCGAGQLVDTPKSNSLSDDSVAIAHLNNQINHALADIMSRHLALISRGCLAYEEHRQGYSPFDDAENRWDFCNLYLDLDHDVAGLIPKKKVTNSMTLAMGSAMIYLSSHIALALSALPFLDRLWVGQTWHHQTLDRGVLSPEGSLAALWKLRIRFIDQQFQTVYDNFNRFLAENVTTASKTLQKSGLVEGKSLFWFSQLTHLLPVQQLVSGLLHEGREEFFEHGLLIATELSQKPALIGQHPFLQEQSLQSRHRYFELNLNTPLLTPEFTSLEGVKKVRKLARRLRMPVESASSFATFEVLGAISYEEGLKRETELDRDEQTF